MTDRLDDLTEARIREACPRHRYDDDFRASCWCDIQRAAILADREARAAWDQAANDVAEAAEQDLADESTHADALAEALRGYTSHHRAWDANFRTWARCECDTCALLASHDKRRGAEGQVRRDVEVRPSRRLSCGCEYRFTKSKTRVRYCEKHYMQLLLESRVRRG